MKTIQLQPSNICGKIKPLHGVGGGPVGTNFTYDATEEFRAAGFPYARLHDIEHPYGRGEFVDIHCIFPDFAKDVNDPASYNFIFTDDYLKCIKEAGTEPFYRLGSSIEHQPIKRYIFPPEDFTKWGEICSHIIAHYNEGWADGFHMGIEYWEIWNEPELKDQCFTGTDEELFELYDIAATIIKRDHPDVKIGGIAPTNPFSPIAENFLAHVEKSGAPIDFFSWHGYSHSPEESVRFANKAEEIMKAHGFGNIESIYDEWNYVAAWDQTIAQSLMYHKTEFCAAYVAGVIASIQNTSVDKAMYYDVQILMQNWNGVFSPGPLMRHGRMRSVIREKPYYALLSWNELYKLQNQIALSADEEIYAAAASDGKQIAVLVSYYNDKNRYALSKPDSDTITFDLGDTPIESAEAYLVDSIHTFEKVPFDGKSLMMEGNTMALVRFYLK